MVEQPAEEVLAEITALLEDRVEVGAPEGQTLYQRVLNLVEAYELWSDLAIRRLHEIHQLTGQECDSCAKWLDEQ